MEFTFTLAEYPLEIYLTSTRGTGGTSGNGYSGKGGGNNNNLEDPLRKITIEVSTLDSSTCVDYCDYTFGHAVDLVPGESYCACEVGYEWDVSVKRCQAICTGVNQQLNSDGSQC